MKGWAIVLLVIGVWFTILSIFICLRSIGDSSYLYAEPLASLLVYGIAFVGGGIYLLKGAAKKKQDRQDRENWNKGEK